MILCVVLNVGGVVYECTERFHETAMVTTILRASMVSKKLCRGKYIDLAYKILGSVYHMVLVGVNRDKRRLR